MVHIAVAAPEVPFRMLASEMLMLLIIRHRTVFTLSNANECVEH